MPKIDKRKRKPVVDDSDAPCVENNQGYPRGGRYKLQSSLDT